MRKIKDSDVEEKIIEFTKDYYTYSIKKDLGDGDYVLERYVDYRDEFPQDAIEKILKSKNPQDTFYEITDEWSNDDWYYQEDFFDKLTEFCEENGFDIDDAREIVYEHFYWEYPDSFLNPTFRAVIMIDNGDANYEYTLHNILNYAADDDAELEQDAGLYWLAQQQGELSELQNEIIKAQNGEQDFDYTTAKGFVQTTIIELENATSSLNALTFLTNMELQDAIDIISGKVNTIVLSSDTVCGLYDSWNGGGSTFDIELDKDVVLPTKNIFKIETNKNIDEVYGFTSRVWKDCVIDVK